MTVEAFMRISSAERFLAAFISPKQRSGSVADAPSSFKLGLAYEVASVGEAI